MSYNPISNSEIAAGSPMDNALLSKIKNNFEAQQIDLAAKQAIIDSHAADLVAKQATLDGYGNTLVSHATSISQNSTKAAKQVPVGTVRSSMLSLAQFQAEVDGIWMLANGGSCIGTNYATVTGNTTVPDMRGMVPRGKNNGRADGKQNPDGDLSLGTQQDDEHKSHTHTQNAHTHTQNAHGHNVLGTVSASTPLNIGAAGVDGLCGISNGTEGYYSTSTQNGNTLVQGSTATNQNTTAVNQNTGGNETRMKNVTVNWFIKVGY